MKPLSPHKLVFTLILVAAVSVALGAWGGGKFQSKQDILHDLDVFANVIHKIESYYVDEVDTHELVRDAIEEMLRELDPHSQLLTGLEYEDLMVSTRGEFGGLGIFIAFRDHYPTVISPIEGTPADRAGLRGGDQIIEIENEPTRDWLTQKAVRLLRGEPGTKVRFKVSRPGLTEPIEYEITREVIEVTSVPFNGMFDDFGYIKVSNFSKRTREELQEALGELESKGMKALVIDMRSNPGGLLETATEVSELFLKRDKLIVYTKGRLSSSNRKYYSNASEVHEGYPIVAMVNGASASASEIFAGALQDWDAGFVVGQPTFGKGTVQTVFSLSDSEAVKLTTAKYYTPSGRNIHKDEVKRSEEAVAAHGEVALASDERDMEAASQEDASADEKPIFNTFGGRVVYGGGGITPDLEFEPQFYTELQRKLERDALFFSFAVEYSMNRKVSEDFDVTEEIMKSFKDFLAEREFEYDEDVFNEDENLQYIKTAIIREINSHNFGRKAAYRAVLARDTELQQVLSILKKAPTLQDLFAYAEEQKAIRAAKVE